MNTTLLIMAAGLGSRYGGNKQMDGVGPHGEMLMEYSIHDAIAAGFDKLVFVIKDSMKGTFCPHIDSKFGGRAEIHYVFQEYSTLPEFFTVPEGRTKPYGTVHAVLCAKDVIHEPFAVINADDYYGREAFAAMAASLGNIAGKGAGTASMVAYFLRNTVSENGTVTRGICEKDDTGCLKAVKETYKIIPFPDGTIRDTEKSREGVILNPGSLVSMNFWGFGSDIFEQSQQLFFNFLRNEDADPLRKEYVLPTLVGDLMAMGKLQVKVLSTSAQWFGMTYKEDRQYVADELKKLHDSGFYPDKL